MMAPQNSVIILPLAKARAGRAQVLNTVETVTRIIGDIQDGGKLAPDDRANLGAIGSVPDTLFNVGIRRRGDDLGEIGPFAGFAILAFVFP